MEIGNKIYLWQSGKPQTEISRSRFDRQIDSHPFLCALNGSSLFFRFWSMHSTERICSMQIVEDVVARFRCFSDSLNGKMHLMDSESENRNTFDFIRFLFEMKAVENEPKRFSMLSHAARARTFYSRRCNVIANCERPGDGVSCQLMCYNSLRFCSKRNRSENRLCEAHCEVRSIAPNARNTDSKENDRVQ